MKPPSSLPSALLVATLWSGLAACGQARTTRYISDLEPVEVGYGTQFRGDVTGAVASVKGGDLRDQRVSRVEDMLQDRVSGLTFSRRTDGTLAVRVRGSRSILGNNEPLVVINGTPINATSVTLALSGLSPLDIARIDVLKDAGSTAAYGSRGANGVILVTTRRSARR